MDTILTNPVLASHMSVKKFLDPRNYSNEIESKLLILSCLFEVSKGTALIHTLVVVNKVDNSFTV